MEKILVRNQKEFEDFIASQISQGVDCNTEYPPDSYPCVIAYYCLDIESMRWNSMLIEIYIYPSDFEIEENQNG